MSRKESDFVIDGKDVLGQAINNAKDYCQRLIDFEYAWTQVKFDGQTYDATKGFSIDEGRNQNGSLVRVKNFKQAYLVQDGQATAVPIYTVEMAYNLKRRSTDGKPIVVLFGRSFFVEPPPKSAFEIVFDCVEWIPDFKHIKGHSTMELEQRLFDPEAEFNKHAQAGDVVFNAVTGASSLVLAVESATTLLLHAHIFNDPPQAYTLGTASSFLLDYCFDFLLARSVYELNFFLKEDQRVGISAAHLDAVWQNVVAWNATIVHGNKSLTLD